MSSAHPVELYQGAREGLISPSWKGRVAGQAHEPSLEAHARDFSEPAQMHYHHHETEVASYCRGGPARALLFVYLLVWSIHFAATLRFVGPGLAL